jgi:VCBS repeat-containing protein
VDRGYVDNTAIGDSAQDPEADDDNDADNGNDQIADYRQQLVATPDVAITKSGSVSVVLLKGTEVAYTLTVKNEGDTTLSGVKVFDTMFDLMVSDSSVFADMVPGGSLETILITYPDGTVVSYSPAQLKLDPDTQTYFLELSGDLAPMTDVSIAYTYITSDTDFDIVQQSEVSITELSPGGYESKQPLSIYIAGEEVGTLSAWQDRDAFDQPYSFTFNPDAENFDAGETEDRAATFFMNRDNTGWAIGVDAGVMNGDRNGWSDHIRAAFNENASVKAMSVSFTNSKDVEVAFAGGYGSNQTFIGSVVIDNRGEFTLHQIDVNGNRSPASFFYDWFFVSEADGPGGAQNKIYTITFKPGTDVTAFDFWVVGKPDLSNLSDTQIKVVDIKFGLESYEDIENIATVDSAQDRYTPDTDETANWTVTILPGLIDSDQTLVLEGITVEDALKALEKGARSFTVKDTADNLKKLTDSDLILKVKGLELTDESVDEQTKQDLKNKFSSSETFAVGNVIEAMEGARSISIDTKTGTTATYQINGVTISSLQLANYGISEKNGSISIAPDSRSLDYLVAGETLTITVSYVDRADALKTTSVQIFGTNDAPVANFTTLQNATEGGASISGQLTATDADTALSSLTYSLVGGPVAGLTLNSNGSWSFNPANAAYDSLAAGATSNVTVNYQVSDGQGGSSQSSFTIRVTGTNDAPVISGDKAISVARGGAVILTTADISASDVDNPDSEVVFLATVSGGSLRVDGDTVSSFSLAELKAGRVSYIHDGSSTNPTLSFLIDDKNEDNSTSLAQSVNISLQSSGNKALDHTVLVTRYSSLMDSQGLPTFDIQKLFDRYYKDGLFVSGFRAVGGSWSDTQVADLALHSNISASVSGGRLSLKVDTGRTEYFEYLLSDGSVGKIFVEPSSGSTSTSNTKDDTVDLSSTTKEYLGVYLDGFDGVDLLTGAKTAYNVLVGGSGGDTLTGGDQSDLLQGGVGADNIFGGAGDDIIYGGSGNDVISGGAGNDRFVYESLAADGVDTIKDFSNGDSLDLSALSWIGQVQSDNVNFYVDARQVGLNTELYIDLDGSGTAASWTKIVVLENFNLTTSGNDLYFDGVTKAIDFNSSGPSDYPVDETPSS